MNYQIKATSHAHQDAVINIKQSDVDFGITSNTADLLPNPAELFLGSLAACILKSVEKFSNILNFSYKKATIDVEAIRTDKTPRMDQIKYNLTVYSSDENLNLNLLKRNIERYGTIYNTVKLSSTISGSIKRVKDV